MKISGFLFILLSLLVLTGCLNPSSQNPIVAQSTVGSIQTDRYTFSIVQTKGSAIRTDEKTYYSGSFDVVVQNDTGAETSRRSLNHSFGNKDLLFDGPVNLILNDYNNDNLIDIPIGFPVGDGSGEYKYVMFSVGEDDKIFTLLVKGYKEKGFVYTSASSHSNQFICTVGFGQGESPGILIGVDKVGGGFAPAKYVWDGVQFVFEKEGPFIISKAVLDANDKYLITVMQTEYKKPLTPDEQGFNFYESMYRGRFDLQIQNSSGKVTSRVSLNKYFGNDELGCIGFPFEFRDYNKDGNYDFAIGQPDEDSPEFQYILLSVNQEGIVDNLSAVGYKEDGFIYSAETQAVFSLLDDGETGIEVTLSNFNNYVFGEGIYLWNGSKFVFSDKAPTQTREKSDGGTETYTDKRFNFSVEYPEKWYAKMEYFLEATVEHNASPDSGINIYVDSKQDEKIYVFGQVSHISPTIDGFHREEFTTNSGLKGHIYSDEINGKRQIDLILGEGFLGARLRISPECFIQNRDKSWRY